MTQPIPEPDPAIKAYWARILDEHGVDLTAIRANLRLTPEQRLARAEAAARDPANRRARARRSAAEENAESLYELLAIKRIREEMARGERNA